MAKAANVSVSSVQRIWRAHGLQPHRVRQFKLSNHPKFVDKLRDVVGLYVDPPAHAIVLSVDEESRIRRLTARIQPLSVYGELSGALNIIQKLEDRFGSSDIRSSGVPREHREALPPP
jgi:hypothetical protein